MIINLYTSFVATLALLGTISILTVASYGFVCTASTRLYAQTIDRHGNLMYKFRNNQDEKARQLIEGFSGKTFTLYMSCFFVLIVYLLIQSSIVGKPDILTNEGYSILKAISEFLPPFLVTLVSLYIGMLINKLSKIKSRLGLTFKERV